MQYRGLYPITKRRLKITLVPFLVTGAIEVKETHPSDKSVAYGLKGGLEVGSIVVGHSKIMY